MATMMLWGMLVMALGVLDVRYRRRPAPRAHDHPEREKRTDWVAGTCSAGEAQVNWGSWDAFWSMGGYGLYVWGSYAMTVIVAGDSRSGS